ncbi:unnamed protein product [Trichogramma brassicae]|uniref:protein-tyrosine-phosphatase n=1 Tax=Trichogramma brassicae TaxID=86971 RepID=A0A6H5HUR6_9HYME|nr:unnamed protein product [Trichogramma brassicae]
MSASSSYKLWRSTTGLDDAGMDLRVAQFSAHTSREFNSASTPAGLEQQLPLLVALCAIAGAILFAFLILLWLRQQMSREKDAEEGDRRGLVEEGTACPLDNADKNNKSKSLTEAKWVDDATSTEISAEASATQVAAAITENVKFEKMKIKQTETRWVAGPTPHVSTSCVERIETASSSLASCSSSEHRTTTISAGGCGNFTSGAAQLQSSNISSTSSSTLTASQCGGSASQSNASSVSMGVCKLTKRSPRREGNRRTRSMYSTHMSTIMTSTSSSSSSTTTMEQQGGMMIRPEQTHIQRRVKGLLERRGSSASLTIDLGPASESQPLSITPTRECAEEFLLSTGNLLNRSQLHRAICQPNLLHKEFWEVPLNFPEAVDICGSGVKNRYRSVLPNARSRVVLPGSDDPLATYINANYVRGYDEDARYIATQGPLSHTIQDFWSMAWAERTPIIVMMTRLHESAKTKCEAYFPLEMNSRLQAGPFTIILNSMDTRGGYTVRDLEVRYENERRIIQHYWYDSWPDHAVPQTADALVGLAAEINTLPGPIIVHCSAGIGRTGCFIALATGMTQLAREGSVDILGILCQMRYDRGGMIQTAEQYEFVHKALCLFEETLERKTTKDDDKKNEKPKRDSRRT